MGVVVLDRPGWLKAATKKSTWRGVQLLIMMRRGKGSASATTVVTMFLSPSPSWLQWFSAMTGGVAANGRTSAWGCITVGNGGLLVVVIAIAEDMVRGRW